jgi:hypothetical protein
MGKKNDPYPREFDYLIWDELQELKKLIPYLEEIWF